MIDNPYTIAMVSALVLCGFYILLKKSDIVHSALWATVTAYVFAAAYFQYSTGDYNIPYHSGLLSILMIWPAIITARKHLILWPLWVSVFFLINAVIDLSCILYTELYQAPKGSLRFMYQSSSNIVCYLSLFVICIHPRLGKKTNDKLHKWSYA